MRRFYLFTITCVVFFIFFLFFSCNDSDIPLTSDGDLYTTISYITDGNKIILYSDEGINKYCIEDSLVVDTFEAFTDTIEFEISGNTLKMFSEMDTLESGAIIKYHNAFARKGSGSGLKGVWSFSEYGYTLISGTLNDSDKLSLEEEIAFMEIFIKYYKFDYEFTEDKMNAYGRFYWADYFIDVWNGIFYDDPLDADSANYDITVSKIDKNSVKLHGNKTAEIVTIINLFVNMEGDITYTSSNPDNYPHTCYAQPDSCPNEYWPDWYYDFMQDNIKNKKLHTTSDSNTTKQLPNILQESRLREFIKKFRRIKSYSVID